MTQPIDITIQEIAPRYPQDPVHGFAHILRVLKIAQEICKQEPQANWRIIRAAVLLHDIEGAAGPEAERLAHQEQAALFAQTFLAEKNWSQADIEAVTHAIRAHRFRHQPNPQTLEAQIVFDADKIDAIGATGVARAIAYAVSHNNPIFSPPSDEFLQTGQKQPDEPHSAYHEYHFKLRNIIHRLYTPSAIQVAQSRQTLMVNFFETLAQEQDFSQLK